MSSILNLFMIVLSIFCLTQQINHNTYCSILNNCKLYNHQFKYQSQNNRKRQIKSNNICQYIHRRNTVQQIVGMFFLIIQGIPIFFFILIGFYFCCRNNNSIEQTNVEQEKTILNKQEIAQKALNVECCICITPDVDCITNCNHYYHIKCINDWLEIQLECPICRKQLSLSSIQTFKQLNVNIDKKQIKVD